MFSILAIVLIVAFIIWLLAQAIPDKLPPWVGHVSFIVLVACVVLLVLGVRFETA